MKVFSTFFKIARKNLGTIIMFIVLSTGLSIVTSQIVANDNAQKFQTSSLDVAIIDRDLSETSKSIKTFIESSNNVVPIEDNNNSFQDNLYNRKVKLILILPKGLEKDLTDGNKPSIKSIEIPNSYSGILFRTELDSYINLLKNYLNTGYSPEEAIVKANKLKSIQTSVSLCKTENTATLVPPFYSYFNYLPYGIIGVLVTVIGFILLAFNKTDLKKRMACSSMPLKQKNLQLALGCLTFSAMLTIILLIPPVILYGMDIFKDNNFIYLFLNQITMTITSISLAFLVGILSKKPSHISMAGTTLSLVLCFLGGIFFPLQLISDSIIKICKFTPAYWYSLNMELISTNSSMVGSVLTSLERNLFIQLGFAVALFGIALVVTRQRKEQC